MKYIYLQFYSAETERSRYVIYATIYKKNQMNQTLNFSVTSAESVAPHQHIIVNILIVLLQSP